MRTNILFCLMLVFFIGYVSSASATASLSVGTVSYDTTVLKDESITITSSVTASSISGTLTVDVTLTDNSGLFTIPTATQQVQFTTDGTQSVTWTITASSTGTNAAPFSVRALGDDGGTTASGTSSTVMNVKDRPVLSVTASKSASTVATGGTVTLGYLVSNSAATGAADATNVVVNLTLPTGFSLTSGTSSYSLGSISAQGSTSGTWVVTADSPSTTNTFTMSVISTIPGGTVSTTTSVSATNSATTSSSSSPSSGSGGGGGGGITAEPFENIAKMETYDRNLVSNTPVLYTFKLSEHSIYEVSVTGNETENYIGLKIEALKGPTKIAGISVPPGTVYKNINIWSGTRRIKEGLIKFKVENTWITDNNIANSELFMVRWIGKEWIKLETSEIKKDDTYTFYEAKTDVFSNFAITALKGGVLPVATPVIDNTIGETSVTPAGMPATEEKKKRIPGFGFTFDVLILSAIYLFKRNRR